MPVRRRADRLDELLSRFVAARTWSGARALVERHPELLGAVAVSRLHRLAAIDRRRRDYSAAATYDLCRHLLVRCATAGVATAFAEIPAPDEPRRPSAEADGGDDLIEAINRGVEKLRTYVDTGDDEALAGGVALLEAAEAATVGTPYRPNVLLNLGQALVYVFQRYGRPPDIGRAVTLLDEAVCATPAVAGDRVACLTNLAGALLDRFDLEGERIDLERATHATREAAASTGLEYPNRMSVLANLGAMHRARFMWWRHPRDLRAAVAAFREAARIAGPDGPRRAQHLTNLGIGLADLAQYGFGAADLDLDHAVAVFDEAVRVSPQPGPGLAGLLAGLGTTLAERHGRTGDQADLVAAIGLLRRALAATPADGPDRMLYAADLGIVLRDRYFALGELTDLDEAIASQREAVILTPPSAPDLLSRLDQLAGSLRIRGVRRKTRVDLAEAVRLHERATATVGGRASLPGRLSNLAGTLRAWYAVTGDTATLGRVIATYRRALDMVAPASSDAAAIRANLGAALLDEYANGEVAVVLDEGVRQLQRAVSETADVSPDLPGRLSTLANGLSEMSLRSDDNRLAADNWLTLATDAYRRACDLGRSGGNQARLLAGKNWGQWAARRNVWSEAVEAYGHAAEAAAQLVRVQHLRRYKETWLVATRDLSADHAYSLVRTGATRAAVEQLEAGRARLLAEVLNVDLMRLAAEHPELAQRFRARAWRLDKADADR